MTLACRYLGLELEHPVMPGAGPWTADPGMVRRLEDAGAAAIVLPSLFEEEVSEGTADGAGPDEYLERLARVCKSVSIPVIASLNGTTVGGWLEQARRMEEAGAQALELNVYRLVTDPYESGEAVELKVREMLVRLKDAVSIPLAIKVSPFHTSLVHFARQLDEAGADGLVLFNRFYQPEVRLDPPRVERSLQLSDPSELLLRLRWLAILAAPFGGSLGCTGGVHSTEDALKAVLAGAHGVQLVSALILHGPERLTEVRDGLARWMDENGLESLDLVRGRLSLSRCPDPAAYERAQYVELLHPVDEPAAS